MNELQYFPKILVVDDVRENLLAVSSLIRSCNAQVITASSGAEALEIVAEEKMALCVLDVQMPEMDGYELATKIRETECNAHTPIIFLTAVHIDQISIFKGYRTGAVDYITKPINKEILLSKIRVFLKLEEVRSKLERAEKRYESIVHEQSDYIIRFDHKLSITFVNSSMAKLFRSEYKNLEGLKLLDIFDDIDAEKYKSEVVKLAPGGRCFTFEHKLFKDPNQQSSQKWFLHKVSGIGNEYSSIDEYQVVLHDITDRKSMEQQLIQERKKAEAATESKSRFLANMSHEIRTPMSAIIGMADLLKEYELPEDATESVDVIKISANNLLSLVNEILDFSKIEANQIDIEKIPFDLKEQISDTVKVFKYSATNHKIELISDISEDIPAKVLGDPARFRQILNNLIGNAVKFTREGTIKIRSYVEKEDESSCIVRTTVSDNGIGIDPDGMKRLFKPFSQTSPDIRRKYGGTGLGLAISKNLTELMDGDIGAESELNKGSVFWFRLKFQIDKNQQKEKGFLTSRMPNKDALKILIVEDNILNQKVASATLRKMGHSVEIANNGKEGVEKFKNKKFDLIVMDIQMPIMNGLDATKAIRQIEKENDSSNPVKIVALTANALLNDRDICLAAGMDEYISKPFRKEDFLRVLDIIM